MIQLIPPEQFLAVQEQQRAERQAANRVPEVLNDDAVLQLNERGEFKYRGRRYRPPPTSFLNAQELERLKRRLELLERDPDTSQRELLAFYRDAVQVFDRCARPWWRRWTPNPFRNASEVEVGHLLAVFYTYRFRSEVDFPPIRGRSPAR